MSGEQAGRRERPETWLPESVAYTRLNPWICYFCATTAFNRATMKGKTFAWCDSPTCEARARAAITGKAD